MGFHRLKAHRLSEKEAWKRVRAEVRRAGDWNIGCCDIMEDLLAGDFITEKVQERMVVRLEAHRKKRRRPMPVCHHYLWRKNAPRLVWVQQQIDSL